MPYRHATVNDAVVTKGIRKIRILNVKTKSNPPSEWENQILKRPSGRPLGLIFGGIPGCLTLVSWHVLLAIMLCTLISLHSHAALWAHDSFSLAFLDGVQPNHNSQSTCSIIPTNTSAYTPHSTRVSGKLPNWTFTKSHKKKILTTACNRHANLNPMP